MGNHGSRSQSGLGAWKFLGMCSIIKQHGKLTNKIAGHRKIFQRWRHTQTTHPSTKHWTAWMTASKSLTHISLHHSSTISNKMFSSGGENCIQTGVDFAIDVQSFGIGGNIGFEPLDINGNYLPNCPEVDDRQPIVTDTSTCTGAAPTNPGAISTIYYTVSVT